MALAFCCYCLKSAVVEGPRNAKARRVCPDCRWRALIELAPLDMISKEEADELNVVLGGSNGDTVR